MLFEIFPLQHEGFLGVGVHSVCWRKPLTTCPAVLDHQLHTPQNDVMGQEEKAITQKNCISKEENVHKVDVQQLSLKNTQ